jgi:hypothetical protein
MLLLRWLVVSFSSPPRPGLIFARSAILVPGVPLVVISIITVSLVLGALLVPWAIFCIAVAFRTVLVVPGAFFAEAAVGACRRRRASVRLGSMTGGGAVGIRVAISFPLAIPEDCAVSHFFLISRKNQSARRLKRRSRNLPFVDGQTCQTPLSFHPHPDL